MSDPISAPSVVALHEAAHAVVLYHTNGHTGGWVSIVPNPDEGTCGSAQDVLSDSSSLPDVEGTILSLYAGGHAQRRADSTTGDDGCDRDDEQAMDILTLHGWETREQEFRDRSMVLVRQHWAEIEAVAAHLDVDLALESDEVEIIADVALGTPGANLDEYRRSCGEQLALWRRQLVAQGRPAS